MQIKVKSIMFMAKTTQATLRQCQTGSPGRALINFHLQMVVSNMDAIIACLKYDPNPAISLCRTLVIRNSCQSIFWLLLLPNGTSNLQIIEVKKRHRFLHLFFALVVKRRSCFTIKKLFFWGLAWNVDYTKTMFWAQRHNAINDVFLMFLRSLIPLKRFHCLIDVSE